MSECCHKKHKPRDEKEIKQLTNRLHRMVGQLNGIENMLKENRYCGDILVQVAAVESALQAVGYIVLQEHLNTCVVEDVQNGNTEIMSEVMDLVKKLKQVVLMEEKFDVLNELLIELPSTEDSVFSTFHTE